MKRTVLLFTVAAMMAVLLSISAGPASALVIGGDSDNGHKFSNDGDGLFVFRGDNHDDDDDFFGFDDDDDFFGFDGDGEVSLGLGDVENESGDIETENEFSIEGNNNNACLGQLQFGNTGNFTNQQGVLQYASDADDLEFSGPDVTFAPENETTCEQDVEQAAAASSWGW